MCRRRGRTKRKEEIHPPFVIFDSQVRKTHFVLEKIPTWIKEPRVRFNMGMNSRDL